MRLLLVNPPHTAIGSRVPDEHLPPLGLLSVGGPLLDAGHEVSLLDADLEDLPLARIVEQAAARHPEAVLLGHSGSTSAHPTVVKLVAALRARLPSAAIVYGGVFPTFHWREVLDEAPAVDFVVRGEGEDTTLRLIAALEAGTELESVRGIAFRREGVPFATAPAPLIQDLDAYRVGWELIDPARYSYWGNKRALVVQFSRGCPHGCRYCGQREFWTRWRHRDPRRFAAELARLHRAYGIEVFNFADENPTSSREAWRELLEAIVAEGERFTLVLSARADDLVRDADLLPLARKAGVVRFLLGTESTDERTLQRIRKGSVPAKDREAIRLLRQNGIISLATWVVGFEEETLEDYLRGLRQLLLYDPDQIQLLYVTPHRWTPIFAEMGARPVVQEDQRLWDYKHQVLGTRHLEPWQVLVLVKLMEAAMQLRPKALARVLFHEDRAFRAAMRWYYRVGRRVWFHEVAGFLLRERRAQQPMSLREFWRQLGDAIPANVIELLRERRVA